MKSRISDEKAGALLEVFKGALVVGWLAAGGRLPPDEREIEMQEHEYPSYASRLAAVLVLVAGLGFAGGLGWEGFALMVADLWAERCGL